MPDFHNMAAGGFLALTLALSTTGAVLAQAVQQVEFVAEAKISGSIKGKEFADYVLAGAAGQVLSVTLEATNPSVNFNVLPLGNPEAIYIGSINGPEFVGRLPSGGEYTIRVYQLGAAADAGTGNDFTLHIGFDAVTLPEQEDALVEGTDFNAMGQLPCSFEANVEATVCEFGVQRGEDGAANIFVTTPSGFVRELAVDADGSMNAPGLDGALETAQEEDSTVVTINEGEEVYTVPEVVYLGD
ncbi:MAG: hypothetical protein ABS75_32925 [Pelagibacterium sp. SCN 63-23]|nr:MAG: hypothetical protein ABS75_32925 [Pelagibacterium sp. SCN 63-23]